MRARFGLVALFAGLGTGCIDFDAAAGRFCDARPEGFCTDLPVDGGVDAGAPLDSGTPDGGLGDGGPADGG